MSESEETVAKPYAAPECSPEQILAGPQIDPRDRIKLYSDVQFEEFVEEWAYFYLQEQCEEYVRVARVGGSGDKGRDVIGYVDQDSTPVVCDVFQCKHYDKPLSPGVMYLELAKLCHHTFEKTIPIPRTYYIVAPHDIGPALAGLLESPEALRSGLVEKWNDTSKASSISKNIAKSEILLSGALKKFVDDFDFGIVKHKPIQEVINEHRKTIRYAPRFGGGLTKPLPATPAPPTELASNEIRYVEQLISVYRLDKGDALLTIKHLLDSSIVDLFSRHFRRSRERFYYAETLREFARDNLPEPYSYQTIQDDVYDGVIDIAEAEHDSALGCVRATTEAAGAVRVGNHPLRPYVKGQSLRGICHQLVNDNRLSWVSEDNGASDE